MPPPPALPGRARAVIHAGGGPVGEGRVGGATAGRLEALQPLALGRQSLSGQGGLSPGPGRTGSGIRTRSQPPSPLGPGRGRRKAGPPAVVGLGDSGWRGPNLSSGFGGQAGGGGSPRSPPRPSPREQRLSVCLLPGRADHDPGTGRGPSSLNCPPHPLAGAAPLLGPAGPL